MSFAPTTSFDNVLTVSDETQVMYLNVLLLYIYLQNYSTLNTVQRNLKSFGSPGIMRHTSEYPSCEVIAIGIVDKRFINLAMSTQRRAPPYSRTLSHIRNIGLG